MPTGTLPEEGRKIFERVYNESLKGSCKGDKACASKIAWTAVKNAGYIRDKNGVWHKKFDGVINANAMHIKASYDKGVMRWRAVNSDTEYDSYDERMSMELFNDFIGRIKSKEPVPSAFRSYVVSDYWSGGMPYLSISHYPDLNGIAVPGDVNEVFIDGEKLKAKGILFDNSLGRAVWKSLKEDEKKTENKIRVSIGFLDLAHRHGDGELWERDNEYSLCPLCLQGIGNKVYVKGYLVHLALTRVPVNKRTEFVPDP